MGQCQHLFVATNSQFMVYIFSSFLRFFLIFQSTRDIGIMKGDYKSNFFDENKRLEKAYYSNTLQRSQKCFRFSASVHFNQLFLRTNRNQIQHIRQPKTVQKEIWNIKKCIQRVGSSSTTCFTKNIQKRIVISDSNKRLCYWFRVT